MAVLRRAAHGGAENRPYRTASAANPLNQFVYPGRVTPPALDDQHIAFPCATPATKNWTSSPLASLG